MTARRTLGGLSTALLSFALLAGCSDPEKGTPTPVGQASGEPPVSAPPTSSSSADHGGDAPRVSEPIDVSGLEEDPCTALSDAQVQKLNLLPGERGETDQGAPKCRYEYDDDSGSRVVFTLVPEFSNGLADLYEREPNLAYFEPTEVSGYPAVYASPNEGRSSGVCQLHVGLTDNFLVSVWVYLGQSTPDYPRGCEVAEMSTRTMIENLKGGA